MLANLLQSWLMIDPVTLLWVRILGGFVTAFLLVFFLCPAFIRKMRALQASQPIRQGMVLSHDHKSNTPTMGGVVLIAAMLVSFMLWADWQSLAFVGVVLVFLSYGAIGAYDDFLKVKYNHSDGMSAKLKYSLQSLVALLALVLCFHSSLVDHTLHIPFLGYTVESLGLWALPLGYCVIVGASNSVNLTDGLDGLAILPSVLVGGGLGVVAYLSLSPQSASYYSLFAIEHQESLVLFCASLAGSPSKSL